MISEDDFHSLWDVQLAPRGDLLHFEDVQKFPMEHVWTIIESGDDADGNWYASPGYHFVNRLGYIVTKRPWIDYTLDAIYFLDDMDEDD